MKTEVLKRGRTTISIGTNRVTAKGKVYEYPLVVWYDAGPKRKSFREYPEAREFAEKKLLELANGRTAANQISMGSAAAIARIEQIAREHNITKPVELFFSEAADAWQLLAGAPLKPAIEFYVKHHPPDGQKSFSDIVDLFMAIKRTDGTLARQVYDLNNRLTHLKTEFRCSVASLTAADIETTLTRLMQKRNWSAHTYNQYRAALANCLKEAAAKQWIPRDWKEMEFVNKLKARIVEREADAPERIERILRACPDTLLGAMVICYFCVVRTAEVLGRPDDNIPPMDWRDVFLDSGEIKVLEGKVRDLKNRKTSRIVRIPANAVKWLRRVAKPSGPIYKGTQDSYNYQRNKLCRELGITWTPNAGRRTAMSIREAEIQPHEDLTKESGTSAATRRKHYVDPQLQRQVKQYRSIVPGRRNRKIVDLTVQNSFKTPKAAVENKPTKEAQTT